MKNNWTCMSNESKINALEELLHSDDVTELREIVFYEYRGSKDDSLLFALIDALMSEFTISSYSRIYKWTRELQERFRGKEK